MCRENFMSSVPAPSSLSIEACFSITDGAHHRTRLLFYEPPPSQMFAHGVSLLDGILEYSSDGDKPHPGPETCGTPTEMMRR